MDRDRQAKEKAAHDSWSDRWHSAEYSALFGNLRSLCRIESLSSSACRIDPNGVLIADIHLSHALLEGLPIVMQTETDRRRDAPKLNLKWSDLVHWPNYVIMRH